MPLHSAMRTVAIHGSQGLDMWFGISRFAKQTSNYVDVYGFPGLFMPWVLSSDVFDLVQSVLRRADDDDLLNRFTSKQVQETSVVAMIGSVIAGNAVAALGKPLMSAVPWPAAAFLQASLVASLFCVYHSMRLNRIVGALVTPNAIKDWLRAPSSKIRSRDKNRPSVSTVLILDTPRTLVAMASVSFVMGWSVYVFFVYIYGLDHVAGNNASMNTMIFYACSLWFAIAVYLKADIFDYYTDREHTWLAIREMIAAVLGLFDGRGPDYDSEEDGYSMPSTQRRSPLPPQAPTHAHQSHETGHAWPPTPSERSERKSLGNALLAEALRESIEARRRAIESDEQFVRALQMYQPDMHSSYDS